MSTETRIRPASARSDYEACVALQRQVWGLEDLEITPAIQLIATVHAGGLLLVAEEVGARIVGFAYAFPALGDVGAHLHSDMLAVLPEARGRGLGLRLKWAQREEARRGGISLLTWTFDPMQARNASLNLRHLGAIGTEFRPDFYGTTTSPLHHGLPTNRLLVRWELDSPRVRRRAAAGPPAERGASAPRINEVAWREGRPVSGAPRLDLDAPELRLEIPVDWNDLCRAAPEEAAAFQVHVAAAFQAYLGRGYVASGFVPSMTCPFYLLRREQEGAGTRHGPKVGRRRRRSAATGPRSTRSRTRGRGHHRGRRGGAPAGRGRR